MSTKIDELVTMSAGAKLAHWGREKFKRFVVQHRLAIKDGGNERTRILLKAHWPTVERVIMSQRHRDGPDQKRKRTPTRGLHPDVTC